MRFSIASRVSIACTAVLALSLLLLSVGLGVGNSVRSGNANVGRLSETLKQLNDHDRAQEQLRLAIGATTRAAEAGELVSPMRWAMLSDEISKFEDLSASRGAVRTSLPKPVRDALDREKYAALQFASSCRTLLVLGRTDPAAVQSAMPRFLHMLKRLEKAHLDGRDLIVREIATTAKETASNGARNIYGVLAGGLVIVGIFSWITVWLRRRLLTPLASIAARLRNFTSEEVDAAIPGFNRPDELGDLARGLAEYRAAYEERRKAEHRAAFLAQHDPLTGIANRLLFESRLIHELHRAKETGNSIAVLAIDVDDFKAINDRYGHAGGDRALQRTAKLLLNSVSKRDLVARLGGDEFAIIQVVTPQPEAAEALISRLFEASAATASEDIGIRMSIGVAVSQPETSGQDLHHLADLALYQAKAEGRNTARFFDESLKEQEGLRLRLARDLEQALAAGELYVEYQPIADAASLKIGGYEALLRWKHPSFGKVSPECFIPIAESTGSIDVIGLWVAEQALSSAANWAPTLTLSLNLSPIQFRQPGLATYLIEAAKRHGVSTSRLEFEVTESATLLGSQRDEVLMTLKALQAAGARVVMDDFGTGYSSLSNLKDFPFDKIKIDRSFVATMDEDGPSALIVKATISLGKSLGLTIVAEGVEEEAQLTQLQRWGCDQVQGYLIGRPTREIANTNINAPTA